MQTKQRQSRVPQTSKNAEKGTGGFLLKKYRKMTEIKEFFFDNSFLRQIL